MPPGVQVRTAVGAGGPVGLTRQHKAIIKADGRCPHEDEGLELDHRDTISKADDNPVQRVRETVMNDVSPGMVLHDLLIPVSSPLCHIKPRWKTQHNIHRMPAAMVNMIPRVHHPVPLRGCG
jgi:hypothetical protein